MSIDDARAEIPFGTANIVVLGFFIISKFDNWYSLLGEHFETGGL